MSRWNERRGAFGLTLAPVVMLLVSLVVGFAALGVKKVNDGLYGTTPTTNEAIASESNGPIPIRPGVRSAPALVNQSPTPRPVSPRFSAAKGPIRSNNWMDHLTAQYRAFRQQYGGDRVVVVVVSGLPGHGDPSRGVTNRDVTAEVTRRLRELVPEAGSPSMFGDNNMMMLLMAPINDRQGLVPRIDFGTVALKGDQLTIQLDSRYIASVPRLPAEPTAGEQPQVAARTSPDRPVDPEVPVGADPITKSLIELKSSETAQEEAGPRPPPEGHARWPRQPGCAGDQPLARG